MKLALTLDYTLAAGWRAPWVEGLWRGLAVASTCGECGAAHFPPTRHCPDCGGRARGWVTLSGRATIRHRTDGADGAFALVRFDGAARDAVVRLDGVPEGAAAGRLLAAPEGAPPALALGPEADA